MYDHRCHHCSQWVGESPDPLTFVGMFKDPRERTMIAAPRLTFRCGKCGWVSVFQRAAKSWRQVEVKEHAAGG